MVIGCFFLFFSFFFLCWVHSRYLQWVEADPSSNTCYRVSLPSNTSVMMTKTTQISSHKIVILESIMWIFSFQIGEWKQTPNSQICSACDQCALLIQYVHILIKSDRNWSKKFHCPWCWKKYEKEEDQQSSKTTVFCATMVWGFL